MSRLRSTLAGLLLLHMAVSAQGPDLDEYNNARFSYAVRYPKKTLIPQGESDNGDGQRFESGDKKFKLIVWGIHNALDDTIAGLCEQRIRSDREERKLTVVYKAVRADWFVYSGTAGDTIIYEKELLKDGVFKALRLEYPAAHKEALDPVVKRIIASFRTL